MDRVQNFTLSADSSNSNLTLKTLFSAAIREIGYHGFDAFSMCAGTSEDPDVEHNFFICDYGPGFIEEYIGRNWLQMDSSLSRAGKTCQPFNYVAHINSCPSNASIKWQRMMARAQNVHHAWLIPLNIVGATRGVTCYMRGKGPEYSDRFMQTKPEIQLLSCELMGRLEELNSGKQNPAREDNSAPDLSAREIDCLHWVARGKSNSEIGVIFEISQNTVRFHLKNAFTKLGVNSRSSAVIVAIREGMIEL